MSNTFPNRAPACAVCGSCEVRTDAVEQDGKSRAASQGRAETSSWLLLAECPRCDHRWTQHLAEASAPARAPVRVAAAAVRPEVANAA
jgi:hypothetical protein